MIFSTRKETPQAYSFVITARKSTCLAITLGCCLQWFCFDNLTDLFSHRRGVKPLEPMAVPPAWVAEGSRPPLLAEACRSAVVGEFTACQLIFNHLIIGWIGHWEVPRPLVIAAQIIPTCPNVSRYETNEKWRLPVASCCVHSPPPALKAVYFCAFVLGVQHSRLVGRRA